MHIEYDNGIAAKVLRLFAQCWLDRDNCPPLRFRFLEMLPHPDNVKDNSLLKHPLEACKGVVEGRLLEEIDVEELPNFPVMLSSFDFKSTGLSIALGTDGDFGPVWPMHALAEPVITSVHSCFKELAVAARALPHASLDAYVGWMC